MFDLSCLMIDNNYLNEIKEKTYERVVLERVYNHHEIEKLKKLKENEIKIINQLRNFFIAGQFGVKNGLITKENIIGFRKNLIIIYETIASIETILNMDILNKKEFELWQELVYLNYTNAYMHELVFNKDFIEVFGIILPPEDYISEGKRIMEAKNRFKVFV